jgi:hypothetical protein
MIVKIIPGFVSQVYRDDGTLMKQQFDQNENEHWENEDGEKVDEPESFEAVGTDMVQPQDG